MTMNKEDNSNNIVQPFEPLPKQKAFMYRVLHDPKAKFTWYC